MNAYSTQLRIDMKKTQRAFLQTNNQENRMCNSEKGYIINNLGLRTWYSRVVTFHVRVCSYASEYASESFPEFSKTATFSPTSNNNLFEIKKE